MARWLGGDSADAASPTRRGTARPTRTSVVLTREGADELCTKTAAYDLVTATDLHRQMLELVQATLAEFPQIVQSRR